MSAPRVRDAGASQQGHGVPFDERDATKYFAFVAICDQMTPGRFEIAYAVSGLAGNMSMPNRGDWMRARRLGGSPRLQQDFKRQSAQWTMPIHIDVDWAGCRESRKSTI